jgi:hypothetical protein
MTTARVARPAAPLAFSYDRALLVAAAPGLTRLPEDGD